MRSILIFVLSAFVSSVFFGVIVFAQEATPAADTKTTDAKTEEAKKQKVYYSESLGIDGEEKVYQISSCSKTRAMAPLRCSKENQSEYKSQCEVKGKLREGAVIRGCLTKPRDADNPYGEVDPKLMDSVGPVGCKDMPEKQSPYYVYEWAIVDENQVKTVPEQDWIVRGTIAWPTLDIPDLLVEKIHPNGQPIDLWRSAYCETQDFPEKGGTVQKAETEDTGPITKSQKDLRSEAGATAQGLIKDNCNNSNTSISAKKAAEFGIDISTPFDGIASVSCTTKYRIVGTGGVDIFSKYVGFLYKWAAGIVGIIAVLTIVYNGIIISTSGSGETTESKERIMQSLAGIAILFLAGLILYTINPTFFTS